MHQLFGAARRIEESVAWGDLATAQVEAGRLAQLDEPDAHGTWQPYFERVRDASRAIEASGSILTAARRTVDLAAACADCHAAIGARPVFDVVVRPEVDASVGSQMRLHQWGAARMWEGLIAPENARWEDGAGALFLAPLVLSETDEARLSDEMLAVRHAMTDRIEKIRGYAGDALSPLLQSERSELYAQLLVTCADCHALVRDGRRAAR